MGFGIYKQYGAAFGGNRKECLDFVNLGFAPSEQKLVGFVFHTSY